MLNSCLPPKRDERGRGSLQAAPIANPARMAFCIDDSSRTARLMIVLSHAPPRKSRFARIEAKH
jgi:hypothetical protein